MMEEKNKNKERPLEMLNSQVILRKIKSDMAKILGEHILNPIMTIGEAKIKMKEVVQGYLEKMYGDFDLNLFDLVLVPVPNSPSHLSIQPQNFITALWLHGVVVTVLEIENMNSFTDEVATYTWDEETKLLGIMPHPTQNFN